jgi:murein peptide amidase A
VAAASLLLVVVALATGPAHGKAAGFPVQRVVVGRSVRGRPIYAYRLGDPGGKPVVVVGCIDGDEPAGIAIVTALRGLERLPGVNLWLIPTINPDGQAADTTGNAHGVDLNRNFPYAWRHLGGIGHFDSGPKPLSEPETRALHRLLLDLKPRLAIFFHQPLALVDDSQGSRRLERTFGRLVGLPVRPLTDYPGSITNWENHHFPHSTAFVTELPPGRLTHARAMRYAHAVLALEEEIARSAARTRSRTGRRWPW